MLPTGDNSLDTILTANLFDSSGDEGDKSEDVKFIAAVHWGSPDKQNGTGTPDTILRRARSAPPTTARANLSLSVSKRGLPRSFNADPEFGPPALKKSPTQEELSIVESILRGQSTRHAERVADLQGKFARSQHWNADLQAQVGDISELLDKTEHELFVAKDDNDTLAAALGVTQHLQEEAEAKVIAVKEEAKGKLAAVASAVLTKTQNALDRLTSETRIFEEHQLAECEVLVAEVIKICEALTHAVEQS